MKETFLADFIVRIPNIERTAIVKTHRLMLPVYLDPVTGDEMVTEEAARALDEFKISRMPC